MQLHNNIPDKRSFIFPGIKAFETMTISVVVFSGLSVRGFGEELVVLCKQRAFPNRIRRADTDRSQTNA